MYAFSQLLGGSVAKASKNLDAQAQIDKQSEIKQRLQQQKNAKEAVLNIDKTNIEKKLESARQQLHNMAQTELQTLQANDQTTALADLVDAEKIEILAE